MAGKILSVEYLWLDGSKPTQKLRSKTRLMSYKTGQKNYEINLDFFPEWSFDGSSTYQASGENSDLILKPVFFCPDVLRGKHAYVVMCEVFWPNGKPHETNYRVKLRNILEKVRDQNIWLGFEQEYTLFKESRPLGWPEKGIPAPQGPYYCGVGVDKVFGRDLVEEHMHVCRKAGLYLTGINAEVMPGQWEFQIGYRAIEEENPNPLNASDHLWIARWFLYRVAEKYDVVVSLKSKPVEGDWNGAGLHTNFSSKKMRMTKTTDSMTDSLGKKSGKEKLNGSGKLMSSVGLGAIKEAIKKLSQCHEEHISVYGEDLNKRLTGKHETCAIDKFTSGVSHRGASIRIPAQVQERGCGYFEDRRPAANANPYLVAEKLITSLYN